MDRIDKSVLHFVEDAPPVKLQKIIPERDVDIIMKLKEFNPRGGVKSRITLQMVVDAEKEGILKPNSGRLAFLGLKAEDS